jgi:hypothetical protein
MKRSARMFFVAAWVGLAAASLSAYNVSNGTMTVLDSSNFEEIDLTGNIVYAVNCGKGWYGGAPTGANPPDDGDWGSGNEGNRDIHIGNANFIGDVWNFSNEARNKNFDLHFSGGNSNEWHFIPIRYQAWESGEAYRAECTGMNTGSGHPTNASPYEGSNTQTANIFPDGTDENLMEEVLGKAGAQNAGGYSAGATDPVTGWLGCGERDMTWHFDVQTGSEYKIQMLFFRPASAGATGQRIEVEDTLCVDMLDVDAATTDAEALLYTYEIAAPDDTLTIKVGRQTDGGGNNHSLCSAITIEKSGAPVAPGIVGYWPLDNNLNDVSGNGHNGNDQNGITFDNGDVPTPLGSGYSINMTGSDRGVRIDSDMGSAFNLDTLTVSCWVKGWPNDDGEPFVSKNGEGTGWQLRKNNSNPNLDWTTRGAGGDFAGSSTNVSDGNWHHIAGTYDGTNKVIYVDGEVDQTTGATGPIDDTNGRLCFGLRENGYDNRQAWAQVRMDDIAIWNLALTATNIANLYAGVSPLDVLKPIPTITTWPIAGSISFGQALSDSVINTNGAVSSVPGNYAFTTPGTQPPVGTANQSMTFTPTDTLTYGNVMGLVSVTVDAPPVPDVLEGSLTVIDDDNFGDIDLTGDIVYALNCGKAWYEGTPDTPPDWGTDVTNREITVYDAHFKGDIWNYSNEARDLNSTTHFGGSSTDWTRIPTRYQSWDGQAYAIECTGYNTGIGHPTNAAPYEGEHWNAADIFGAGTEQDNMEKVLGSSGTQNVGGYDAGKTNPVTGWVGCGERDMTWSFDVTPGAIYKVQVMFYRHSERVDSSMRIEIEDTLCVDELNTQEQHTDSQALLYSYQLTAPDDTLTIAIGKRTDNSGNGHGHCSAITIEQLHAPVDVLEGALTLLNRSNFDAIDLDGVFPYAVNCGKDWYAGAPTGPNPPENGNWGSLNTEDRAHTIKNAYFEGDIWNYSNEARHQNYAMNFGIGNSNAWHFVPTRFQGWETGKTYRAECTGSNTGGSHPTNAAPYEDYQEISSDIFPNGDNENKMEQILARSGVQNAGNYNAANVDPITGWTGCGEQDITWHFNVQTGRNYKVQMLFSGAAGATGQRIEINDTLCVDKLNVDSQTTDTEALLYTYFLTATNDTLTIKAGRQTDSGGASYIALCSAITIEDLSVPTISGYVRDTGGNGISGITISANNGGGSSVTDGNGFYSIPVPDDWSGTVTPNLVGYYDTSPASRSYSNVAIDDSGEDYVRTAILSELEVIRGTMSVLHSSNFGVIDFEGNIVHAINCGKAWYTGTPTGLNPPAEGNWGDADTADRELQIGDAYLKGDIWNDSNDARDLNSQLYFGGSSTEWSRTPMRFQGWETGKTYRAECSGSNTGSGHPTNAAPYEGTHDFAAEIFPDGSDENKMESVLSVSAIQNSGFYNAESVDPITGWRGCGERDMTWHFDVEPERMYKIQMFFYRSSSAGPTGQRIEIEDTLCVDKLDVNFETSDTEALLYTHVVDAWDGSLTIKVGRRTDNARNHNASCCAITLEDLGKSTYTGFLLLVR